MSGYVPRGFIMGNPRVKVSEAYCSGCANCLSVCIHKEVLEMRVGEQGKPYAYAAHPENCAGCGRCVSNCPTHSICMSIE